jgi:hypothetical protein
MRGLGREDHRMAVAMGMVEVEAEAVVGAVAKLIRQRRVLGVANEIRAISSASSAIIMDTTPIDVRRRRRRSRRHTMLGRWMLSRQCCSQKWRSRDCSSTLHKKFRGE